MKRLMRTLALTCAYSTSVFAGEVPSVGIAPPPPRNGIQATSTTSPGEIPSGGYTISDAALNLIQILLAAGI
jgi:hypothetical protein